MRHFVENVFMIKWAIKSTGALLVLLTLNLTGQNIPIGTWRTHFSYNNIQEITDANGKIVCASEHGLFFVDPANSEITTLSKPDGFSDVEVTSLAYDVDSKTLVVAYSSGLIDFFTNGKVSTVRDLYRSILVGSKEVNDVITYNGRSYAGCKFGVLEISLETKDIINNFRSIGPAGVDANITELLVFDNQLFAVSDRGIQHGNLSKNLPDFNNWVFDTFLGSNVRSLTIWNDQLYAIVDNTKLAQFKIDHWEIINSSNSSSIEKLIVGNGEMYGFTGNAILTFSNDSWIESLNLSNSVVNTAHYLDGFWLGHGNKGLESPSGNFLNPEGPYSDNMYKIRYLNNQIHAFYGIWPEEYKGQVDSLGYDSFDNSNWTYNEIDGFYNISDGAYFNKRLYLSSVGYGIYDTELQTTIELGDNLDGYGPVIPQLAAYDNLYAISWRHDNSLFIIDENNQVTPISSTKITSIYPQGITVSTRGSIWIANSLIDGGGVITFNPETDDLRYLSTLDGLSSNFIRSLVINEDDEAWVTMNNGARIFADATYVPENDSKAYSPIYENQALFNNEDIKAIAFDGGNRPWINTQDGLWVFDENITKVEHHFNIENSSLPSHDIKDIAYNSKTGEMYILTDKGLVSYRSESSGGQRTHSNVKIFPNPVRPGYSGQVGISGLVSSAYVKITDVNGKLVRQMQANGSTTAWDLNDYNGHRVSSGVYVVFSSSWDGIDTYIGKLAVIN